MEGASLSGDTQPALAPRKSLSSPSLLSRIPFMRTLSGGNSNAVDSSEQVREHDPVPSNSRALAAAAQQQQSQVRTRRRRGSLRKVALLSRGAQRDKKDSSPLVVDTTHVSPELPESAQLTPKAAPPRDILGLSVPDLTPRVSTDAHTSRISLTNSSVSSTGLAITDTRDREQQSTSYTSTTDEEDLLHIPHAPSSHRPNLVLASGSESYFNMSSGQRRASFHRAKSPLSYSGMSTAPLQTSDSEWDYSETEWWGWVVLTVTWFVFVIGMGSCLDVWSWAWDVGRTPYAPPELHNDPTLPIVGYYPTLMILTCVMAWVWVVVAWIGMKYFRHAKISGD